MEKIGGHGDQTSRGTGRGRAVLIVEDDHLVARTVARECGRFLPATVVHTAADAYAALAASPPSAIIPDIRLGDEPDRAGLDVIAAARGRDPSLPALALTALTEPDVVRRIRELGAWYVLKATSLRALHPLLSRAAIHGGVSHPAVRRALEELMMSCRLTVRETQVLVLRCARVPRLAIADELGIGVATLKDHLESLHGRTGRTLEELYDDILWSALPDHPP